MKKQEKKLKNDSSAAKNPVDSEPEPKWVTEETTFVKVEEGSVLLDLVGKVQVLSENYETLSKAYVDLKALFDRHEDASKRSLAELREGGNLLKFESASDREVNF